MDPLYVVVCEKDGEWGRIATMSWGGWSDPIHGLTAAITTCFATPFKRCHTIQEDKLVDSKKVTR